MATFNVNNGDTFTPEDTVDLDSVIEQSGITEKTNETENTGVIDVAEVIGDDDVNNSTDDDYQPVSLSQTPNMSKESSDARYSEILNNKLKYLSEKDSGRFGQTKEKILTEIEGYKKNLITKRGFTPEEAEEAAKFYKNSPP